MKSALDIVLEDSKRERGGDLDRLTTAEVRRAASRGTVTDPGDGRWQPEPMSKSMRRLLETEAEPSLPSDDFQAQLRAAGEEKARFIMRNREALLEAWVAETGLLPSESVLVERRCDDGRIEIHVERRGAFEV
jgi:hypothetical protein